jgi:NAD(P)-dependent dehydrogenase (short-subunit alcohol dehydrogenase family)
LSWAFSALRRSNSACISDSLIVSLLRFPAYNSPAIQLDVTDENSIVAAAKRIRSELGRLDVLVNNAAISHTRRLPGMSVEELGVGDQWNRKPA